MAAIPQDTITIRPLDGTALSAVAKGQSNVIGLYLDYNGRPYAIDATPTCTARFGNTTVTLSPSVGTTGETSATLSDANLTTLGAGILDAFSTFWQGTITVSGTAIPWSCEIVHIVHDRVAVMPILLSALERALPWMAKPASVPAGQSSWWPVVMDAISDARDMLSLEGEINTRLLTNPSQLRPWLDPFVRAHVCRVGASAENGQGPLTKEAERLEKVAAGILPKIVASVKAGTSAFGTTTDEKAAAPARVVSYFEPNDTWGGW